ncbi:MAG: BrnT family toxin [Prochlorococcaceae cyanobacterium]
MPFEYDPIKSAANHRKHGIDFKVAQGLWADPNLLEIPARLLDEPRSLVIGQIAGKHWSAVITYRNTAIRLISVRRSRPDEIALYNSPTV